MTYEKAELPARAWLEAAGNGHLALVSVLDKPYGWVFLYNDKAFLDWHPHEPLIEEEFRFVKDHFRVGAAPFIINRFNGDTGTARSPDE